MKKRESSASVASRIYAADYDVHRLQEELESFASFVANYCNDPKVVARAKEVLRDLPSGGEHWSDDA